MIASYRLIDLILITLVIVTGVAAVRVRNLFVATMLMSIYSLLMAMVWMNLDSMDVSFTEAAVGAGISTVLLIGTLAQTGTAEKVPARVSWTAVAIVGLTTAALLYGTLDMPRFGDPKAPVHVHPVSVGYIEQNVEKTPDAGRNFTPTPPLPPHQGDGHHRNDYFHGHVPNYVTAVIVSYRGYDTMYETTVILIAGMSMVLLLRRRRKESP